MTFEQMKALEPELSRLEESARFAGANGATWLDVLFATNETLTKHVGRGAIDERLQSAVAYEVARAALFTSWSRGAKAASPAAPVDASGQQTFIDVSEPYQ